MQVHSGEKIMKHILLATTLLAISTGFAAADIALEGSARMGVISDFGSTSPAFTSRVRVRFVLSGTTDGGLAFGGAVRSDNAVAGNLGQAGFVFASGAFGRIEMGDVDGAANSAVGQASTVGLTELNNLNEITYIALPGAGLTPATPNTTSAPGALYSYATGDLTYYASATNPGDTDAQAYALGAKYVKGNYTVGVGYETLSVPAGNVDHIVVGGSAVLGATTLRAIYGKIDGLGVSGDQWALSADYVKNALTLTAFYADDSKVGGDEAYGLGASYDLGGGAAIVGGYAKSQTTGQNGYDIGISMSF